MKEQRFTNRYIDSGQSISTDPTSDEKTLGILSHALTFVSQFLAPLIIYLVKKDDSKFVAEQAKESLNFQMTVCLVCIALFITVVGVYLIGLVVPLAYLLVIIASIKASEGKIYRYPLTIRFIK